MESNNGWINGSLHREDGPAIEGPNGDIGWYIDGREISSVLVIDQKDPRQVRLAAIMSVYKIMKE